MGRHRRTALYECVQSDPACHFNLEQIRKTDCRKRLFLILCNDHRDIASASLIEVWIDETERRTWFLFEATRSADATGR